MRHVVTTTIDAPADLVWRTVEDVEKWSDWTPTVIGIRRHDSGDLHEGSTAEVRQPKQPPRTWTVTELVEGRSFAWTSTSRGLRLYADHAVTADPADGGATVVELTFGVDGPLAPLDALLGGKAIRTAVDTEAASLKAWCERTSR